jgi:acyl-CoA hydrolase
LEQRPLKLKQLIESKIVDIETAFKYIHSDMRIVTAMAACEPRSFFTHLHQYISELENIRVYCANPSDEFPCFDPNTDLTGKLELLVMFLTSAIRKGQGNNRIHYIPQHLSNWAANLTAEEPVDIFWGSCTTPDDRGFVSLGPSACYETEIFHKAKVKILEINPQMPSTVGATTISTSDVTKFVMCDHELPSLSAASSSETDFQVAEFVCELVPDGATLQLGIGAIPNAIGKLLTKKTNLGIHTEMINDSMVDLYESGAVNNSCKSIWPGKIVGSFAYGGPKLYEFLDNNPLFEFHPSSVVNDPYRIGRNHKMISINTAVEIDLTGQVCSESIGHTELSGVGGASETHIGAQRSSEGRGIIAINSLSNGGKHSKIVFELKPGAKISISRNDIDTVVTEFGVARLKGKSVAERCKLMIGLAHPSYRDELMKQAIEYKYI